MITGPFWICVHSRTEDVSDIFSARHWLKRFPSQLVQTSEMWNIVQLWAQFITNFQSEHDRKSMVCLGLLRVVWCIGEQRIQFDVVVGKYTNNVDCPLV